MFGMQDQNKPSAASLFAQPTPETPAAPVSTTATEPAASTMPAASPFSPAYPPDIPVDTPVPEPTPPLTAAVQPSPAVDTPPAPAPTILDAPDEPANNPFLNSFNKPTLVDDSQNTAPPSGAPTVDDKLLDIKQNALEQLSPLVEHL